MKDFSIIVFLSFPDPRRLERDDEALGRYRPITATVDQGCGKGS